MFSKLSILLLVAALVETVTAICPPGYSQFESKCYKVFSNEYRARADAAARCQQDKNGTLAAIPNAFVNSFLSQLANNLSDTQFLIGINCPNVASIGDASSCTWDDGTPFTYQNFMPNSPYPNSPCAYMDTMGKSSGFWQSYNCNTQLRFACQTDAKNAVLTTPSTPTVIPAIGGCNQGTLYAPGTINSPNWPGNYPPGVQCKYNLQTANPLQRIHLTFTTVDVEQFDPIYIYDGPTEQYPMIGALRGNYHSLMSYNSTNSQMLVTFASSRERIGHGFVANFQELLNN